MITFLFYNFYKYSIKFSDKDEYPHWFAASLLSGILTINAITLIDLLQLLGLHSFERSTFSLVLMALIIFVFVYFRILYKERYLQIFNFYHSQKNKTRIFLYNLAFGFYLLFSIFLMIYINYLKYKEGVG